MKKITYGFLIAAFAFGLASCEKAGTTENRTINVSIEKNQSYSTVVSGEGFQGNLEIEKQGIHYSESKVTPVLGSPDVEFRYTPALDYAGTDEVIISNESMSKQCPVSSRKSDKIVYDFRITVTDPSK